MSVCVCPRACLSVISTRRMRTIGPISNCTLRSVPYTLTNHKIKAQNKNIYTRRNPSRSWADTPIFSLSSGICICFIYLCVYVYSYPDQSEDMVQTRYPRCAKCISHQYRWLAISNIYVILNGPIKTLLAVSCVYRFERMFLYKCFFE